MPGSEREGRLEWDMMIMSFVMMFNGMERGINHDTWF